MLKKTISYVDYDGNQRTEDHYFNLTKAEIAELELREAGGLKKMIERIVKAEDSKTIFSLFKEIIIMSYGEKSPDGRRFMKSKEIAESFTQTEAFSNLIMELITVDGAMNAFVDGIIPQKPQTNSDVNTPPVNVMAYPTNQ